MTVICQLCKKVQKGDINGRCNESSCIGRLEEAFRCNSCHQIQKGPIGKKCITTGCFGELKRQKMTANQPKSVVPSSHVVFPTASEEKKFSSEPQVTGAVPQLSGEKVQFRAQLEAKLKTGPTVPTKSQAKETVSTIEAPKVLKSEIPVHTVKTRNLVADVQFVTNLMKSSELRKIIIINMLDSYEPSEGAKKAIQLTKDSLKLKEMTLTMNVLVKDAPSWNTMGFKSLASGFAACQQCVAIMFHKLVQSPTFSSCIQLVHITGHHFLVFGEMNRGEWVQNKAYVVDLWLQNLHRPKVESLATLGNDSPAWQVCVTQLLDKQQTFYAKWFPNWQIDLTYDPLLT